MKNKTPFDLNRYWKVIVPFVVALAAQPAIVGLFPPHVWATIDGIMTAMIAAGYAAPPNALPTKAEE